MIRLASLKGPAALRAQCAGLDLALPVDDQVQSGRSAPLAQPLTLGERAIGNRFCALPMEGWDCAADGSPGELTARRWLRFGRSGAKLLWMEACAVREDGRSSPRQLMITERTASAIGRLREQMVETHRERFGSTDGLLIGLQLTHSGRFSKPHDSHVLEPVFAYHHPVLDPMFGVKPDHLCISDEELDRLAQDYVTAARRAREAGFDFVDVKHCHGYLLHELLSARDRPGRYGGTFENRTHFVRQVVSGIKAAAPGLAVAVRLSAFDFVPYRKGPDGVGVPSAQGPYRHAFGGDGTGQGIDLTEPLAFLDECATLGVQLVCITAGSPYYNPHIQRPASNPPCDGYLPPEDPLVGVNRQVQVVAQLKKARPGMLLVGSGYTYLQEFLPHVVQAVVRTGMADSIGIGRGLLSYPDIVTDILEGKPLDRKRVCRTISDCTTAPRKGLVSGCYPLDEEYRKMPEYQRLVEMKKGKGTGG